MKKFQSQLLLMNKKGFTLLETMIILLIVSIVLAFVSYRPSGHLTKEIESRLFFEQIENTLKLSQQQAVVQNKNILIVFSVGTQTFTVQDKDRNQFLYIKEFPEHITLTRGIEFTYYPQGGVSNFDTVVFQDTQSDKLISLVFQLGNGQFEFQ